MSKAFVKETDDEGDLPDRVPARLRRRIQIDAQLVRVVQVIAPDRMRVQIDAA